MTIIPRATVGLNGPISWKQQTVHMGLLVLRQRQGQLHALSVYAGRGVGDFRHGMLQENSAVLSTSRSTPSHVPTPSRSRSEHLRWRSSCPPVIYIYLGHVLRGRLAL